MYLLIQSISKTLSFFAQRPFFLPGEFSLRVPFVPECQYLFHPGWLPTTVDPYRIFEGQKLWDNNDRRDGRRLLLSTTNVLHKYSG